MSIVLPTEPTTNLDDGPMTVLPFGVTVWVNYRKYKGLIPTAVCPEYLLDAG